MKQIFHKIITTILFYTNALIYARTYNKKSK